MTDTNQKIDLDLRGTPCPMAFVKFRLFAEAAEPNSVVTVLYELTPANEPLVRSICGLGHQIVEQTNLYEKMVTPNATAKKIALNLIKVQVNK